MLIKTEYFDTQNIFLHYHIH